MDDLTQLLRQLQNPDGLLLGIILFSSGIGIGASVVQINSILFRKASDAVTSVITWALLFAFSVTVAYYLWHTSEFLVLPAMLGFLALSALAGLVVSIRARATLARVEQARRQQADVELERNAAVLRAAFRLKRRVREAREQRTPAA